MCSLKKPQNKLNKNCNYNNSSIGAEDDYDMMMMMMMMMMMIIIIIIMNLLNAETK